MNTISNNKVLSSAAVPELKMLHAEVKLKINHLHRKQKAKDEWTPQIPVSDFFPFLLNIVGAALDAQLQGVHYNLKFGVNTHQVSLDRFTHRLVECVQV